MKDYKIEKFHEVAKYGKEYLATAQESVVNNHLITYISTFGDHPHDIDIEFQREKSNLWLIIDDNRDSNNPMRGNAEIPVSTFLDMTRDDFDYVINEVLRHEMFPNPEY